MTANVEELDDPELNLSPGEGHLCSAERLPFGVELNQRRLYRLSGI